MHDREDQMEQHMRFRFAAAVSIIAMAAVLSLPAIALPSDQHCSFGMTVGADSGMTLPQTLATVPYSMEAAVADNVSTPDQAVSTLPAGTPPFHVRLGDSTVTDIEGRAGWSYPSDVRMKKDIENIGYGLSFIKQLRPVQYKLRQGNDRYDFGFIAQEVEFLLGDDYNVLVIGGGPDRMLSLRYTDFIAPLVKAVQEQQAQLEAQRAMLEELRAEIAALKRKAP